MASRNDSQNVQHSSENPRWDELDVFDDGSFRQGANIHNSTRENLSRGGSHRAVAIGGEYLSGEPRRYESEEYSAQGFGRKTRAETNWRNEDRVFGPRSVANEPTPGQYRGIGPKSYRRSDERIKEDACEALSDDMHLDASNIEVQVTDGEITLQGTVDSRHDKRRAEEVLDGVRGVRDVHNQLRIAR